MRHILAVTLILLPAMVAADEPVRIKQHWRGPLPVEALGLLRADQRLSPVGYVDPSAFEAVWKLFQPGGFAPLIDPSEELVVIIRNTTTYAVIKAPTVSRNGKLIRIAAETEKGGKPVTDKVYCRMMVVPLKGARWLRFGEAALEIHPLMMVASRGLQVSLRLKKTTFTIPKDRAGATFRKKLLAGPFPPPATLGLTVRITNRGRVATTLRLGGDESRVMLDLRGPGAVAVRAMNKFTTELRRGKDVTLAAGAHHDIPVDQLRYGFRGTQWRPYWTEPGSYSLRADVFFKYGTRELRLNTFRPTKLEVKAAK